MHDDRLHAAILGSMQTLALLAVPCIGLCHLVGPFGNARPLHADHQAGVVHHREHAGKALVLLTDEPAYGPLPVTIGHGAGRRAMDAKLVLQANRADIIACAKRAILIDKVFGDEKQRNPPRTRRCVRQGAPEPDARCCP